ncbi:disulfide bond formation protein DsbB [Angulomicrobium tetraedrale]|uniref:Disulfide bond formation protein DsbB n=1 Tax=Ancylobacter tetraedralis TaxID=217068 RepID=A0A839Z879_9HYPH|nr:disulfide bond formation protein B [Ancylobacter tetraedralis]MBB3771030.1 disulfide bond formation protein DsbB [Ancylobacter tetraedralis]
MTAASPVTSAAASKLRSVQTAAALIVAVAGAGTLAGAWYFQLVVGLAPCPLCLEQRIPYYVGVPVALIAVICALGGRAPLARVALALAGTLMAVAAALAVYHAGVEWGLWAGPTACSGSGPALSSGNLLESLQQARVVRCDEAPWRLLGLSLAGYNALIASALTLVAFRGAAAR